MIHKFFWLWVPLAALMIQACIEVLVPSAALAALHSENGPHELLQFFVIVLAFFIAVFTFIKIKKTANPMVSVWLFIAAACCFYVAAEEVSWGQHFFEWATPEFWSSVNDQGETNLHNTSSWLDQKPRLLLEIGVVIGGLIIPLILKFRPTLLPRTFSVLYPNALLSTTAGIFLILKLVDKADHFGISLLERGSEVQELYLFYFVLLYLLVLKKRLLHDAKV